MDGEEKGWVRVSLPPLRMMTGPVQHISTLLFWMLGVLKLLLSFLRGRAFWEHLRGSLQLLTSSHLRERDKMLLRAILCGSVWNGFLLGKAKKEDVPCRFCGKKGWRWALFFGAYFSLLLQHVRELPELTSLMSLDRSNWLRCLLWHGWFPGLGGISEDDPWASSFGDLAFSNFERCLGAYPVDCSGFWSPPEYWDADVIALEMSDHPNFWTDGSREDFSSVGGFEVAGAGVYLPASELAFENLVWGTIEEYGDARLERCRAFLPVPVVLQTVQRAEFWVLLLPCRRTGHVIEALITSMLLRLLEGCWTRAAWLSICLWLRTVIWSLLSST